MIGEQTVNAIGEAVTASLLDHMAELDQAYSQTEETMSVSISVKLRPVPEGNRIEVGLSFVTSRVKTSVVRIVNEKQMSFLKDITKITAGNEVIFDRDQEAASS